MKVALIQIDGRMPNLALMKLAAWHKKRGDSVTLIDLSHLKFDRFYGSKIFMGGSGIDLKSELPPEIELEVPDYELFHMSKGEKIGFTSRGCIRDCGFCIVREKEGMLRETPFDWDGAERIIFLDNNFLESSACEEKLEYLIRHKIKACWTQGLDIRSINDRKAELLSQVLYYDSHFRKRRLYFAFDNPNLESIVRKGIDILTSHEIKPEHLMFYVLTGYDTTFEQDMQRFKILDELGCLPFIKVYNDRKDIPILRHFARWVNRRYYKICTWQDYLMKKRRG